jgi:hypothetical protein
LIIVNTPGITNMCGIKKLKGALPGALYLVGDYEAFVWEEDQFQYTTGGLMTMDGAEGITSVGLNHESEVSMYIRYYPALSSTLALANATFPNGASALIIQDNPNLCDVPTTWPEKDRNDKTIRLCLGTDFTGLYVFFSFLCLGSCCGSIHLWEKKKIARAEEAAAKKAAEEAAAKAEAERRERESPAGKAREAAAKMFTEVEAAKAVAEKQWSSFQLELRGERLKADALLAEALAAKKYSGPGGADDTQPRVDQLEQLRREGEKQWSFFLLRCSASFAASTAEALLAEALAAKKNSVPGSADDTQPSIDQLAQLRCEGEKLKHKLEELSVSIAHKPKKKHISMQAK